MFIIHKNKPDREIIPFPVIVIIGGDGGKGEGTGGKGEGKGGKGEGKGGKGEGKGEEGGEGIHVLCYNIVFPIIFL